MGEQTSSDAAAQQADGSGVQHAQPGEEKQEDGREGAPSAEEHRHIGGGEQQEAEGSTAADEAARADTDGRTAHLASLAEQADIRSVVKPGVL